MIKKDVRDCEGRPGPVIKKIRFLMDHIGRNCPKHYWPGADIAYDKISVQMSGWSTFKKQLLHKPIGAGIQFWAMADNEPNKFQNTLLRLVKQLPPGSKNYHIAADNLFNSVDTCSQVAKLCHRIYGTLCGDRGVLEKLKAKSVIPKTKGDSAFVQSPADDLTMWAWCDSK
eukprot:1686468-Rhodomonas_salina.2